MAKDLTANEKELVERAWKSIPIYNCRVVDRGGVPFDVIDDGRLITRDDFHNILTRFLAEARDVDANELLQELAKICPHSYLGYARVPKVDGVTVDKLAAALVSAQKGKSK